MWVEPGVARYPTKIPSGTEPLYLEGNLTLVTTSSMHYCSMWGMTEKKPIFLKRPLTISGMIIQAGSSGFQLLNSTRFCESSGLHGTCSCLALLRKTSKSSNWHLATSNHPMSRAQIKMMMRSRRRRIMMTTTIMIHRVRSTFWNLLATRHNV